MKHRHHLSDVFFSKTGAIHVDQLSHAKFGYDKRLVGILLHYLMTLKVLLLQNDVQLKFIYVINQLQIVLMQFAHLDGHLLVNLLW